MAPKSKIKITQLKIKILDQGNQRLRCPYHVYKKPKYQSHVIKYQNSLIENQNLIQYSSNPKIKQQNNKTNKQTNLNVLEIKQN